MTQQTIDFQPAERLSLCDKLEAYLRARPLKWIDGRMFGPIAGEFAWRTRISNLRRDRGMTIENRVRTIKREGFSYRISEYMFVPEGE
jgi:hypothetical protein